MTNDRFWNLPMISAALLWVVVLPTLAFWSDDASTRLENLTEQQRSTANKETKLRQETQEIEEFESHHINLKKNVHFGSYDRRAVAKKIENASKQLGISSPTVTIAPDRIVAVDGTETIITELTVEADLPNKEEGKQSDELHRLFSGLSSALPAAHRFVHMEINMPKSPEISPSLHTKLTFELISVKSP